MRSIQDEQRDFRDAHVNHRLSGPERLLLGHQFEVVARGRALEAGARLTTS
jgi:hypothetical protein